MYFPSQGLVLVVLYCSTVQCKQETGFSGALDPPVDKDGWQRHLEEGGSNNNFTWNSPSNSYSKQCFQVCVCTEHYADCSGRGLIIPPKVGGTNTPSPEESVSPALIRTLDLSENNLEELNENDLLPFSNLQKLILKKNQLAKIPKLPKVGKRLQTLNLGGNQISEMKSEDLQQFPELLNLDLENNLLTLIQDSVFAGNSKLAILNLGYNRISSISEGGFRNLKNLQILVLEENQLTSIQESVFIHTQNILILTLAKNLIERIEENILQYCSKLEQLELAGNPIHFYHQDAFINLPRLKKLQILSSPRFKHRFPNLTGTPNLELIHLDRANIDSIPENLCSLAPSLQTLRMRSNRINFIPNLTNCSLLRQLDLGSNNISSLDGSTFQNLGDLQDLLLDRNELTNLTEDVFFGLSNLQTLNLEKNNISEIHEKTFLSFKNLKDLNLGENSFPALPHQGLQNLVELKTHNNPNLKEFPGAQLFPSIRLVRPSYAYHCCQFLPSTYSQLVPEYADFTDLTEQIYYPEDFHNAKINNQSISWTSGNLSAVPGKDLSLDLWENFVSNMGYPDVADYDENSISFFKPQEGIDCYPAPGPFLPCNDLFDWWSLRCGVWIVFLLALLGNGCVVFVLVLSRSKMDVPRFLVANLAAADFCMGLYLGFLAVLDASTLGEFRKYAIQWQLSSACQVAGFFGVLSSELSVFTLAVITLERNYAITHAMHLNKRLSLKHAAYIMVGAWSFSILLASLPLIGVSDYRKFAICLPFETEGALSLGYVIFLLLINGVAFSILMGCYLKMYCAIRGSQAWNSNDSRIAKRMALLVFTDFICWFPIAFLGITSAAGAPLISLEGAKVFAVFVLPLNSCCNPFLYAILTKQFKKDCVMICKAIEESRVTRGIGRCRHSSNFSNRQTPANTDSLNSGSGSGNHSKNSQHCSCTTKKVNKLTPRWPLNKLKSLLCGIKESPELNSQNEWNYQIAEIQEKQNKTKRNTSVSSENFSSSRSGSWKQGHCVPLRFLERPRRRNSWTVTRKPSQDSNLSSSRNDSAGSNSTQSTNTWRMSRSSVSSDIGNSLGRAGSGYSDRSGGRAGSILVRGKPRLTRQVAIHDDPASGSSAKSVTFQDGRPGDTGCPVHDMAQYSRYRTLYAKLTESSHEEDEEQGNLVTTHPIHHHPAGSHGISNPLSSIPDEDELPSPTLESIPGVTCTNTDPPRIVNNQSEVQKSSNISDNVVGDQSAVSVCGPELLVEGVEITVDPTRPNYLKLGAHSPHLSSPNPRYTSQERNRRISLGVYPASVQPVGRAGGSTGQYGSLTNLVEPRYGPQKCTSENALLALQAKYGYSFQSAAQTTGIKLSKSDNKLAASRQSLEAAASGLEAAACSLEDVGREGGSSRGELTDSDEDDTSKPVIGELRTLLPQSSHSRTPTIDEEPEGEAEKFL